MDMERAMRAVSSRLGRFHAVYCTLLSLAYVYQALFNFTYVFTTMRSEHRCFIPECESLETTEMQPPWLETAIPAIPRAGAAVGAGAVADGWGPEPCSRYAPRPAALTGEVLGCPPGLFSNVSVQCEQRVFPNKDLSIMTEWDMACSLSSEWLLALVGAANGLGRALGLTLGGYVSDALGRKAALLGGLAVSCVLGVARSFASNYATFISFEFLDPIFYDCIGGTAFIMGMELVPTRWRGAWTAYSHVMFAVGMCTLGAVAWSLPYWRWLLRVVYCSALLCLAALWFVPESVRWLVAKGRIEDAQQIIIKVAKMNGIHENDLQSDKFSSRRKKLEENTEVAEEHINSFSEEMKELVHSRVLVLRLLVSCICWITIMFAYDGLSIYSVSLAGNRYVNFILVALIEVPAALLTWKLMVMVGRRATLVVSLVLASACCVAYHFLPSQDMWPRTSTVMLAKLCITISFTVTYVMTAELFPTRVRQTLYALCATCGRFGSALAPQMPLLATVMDTLPLIVFGCTSLATGLLALTLPETARISLPDSVGEAAAIGRKPAQLPDATAHI